MEKYGYNLSGTALRTWRSSALGMDGHCERNCQGKQQPHQHSGEEALRADGRSICS